MVASSKLMVNGERCNHTTHVMERDKYYVVLYSDDLALIWASHVELRELKNKRLDASIMKKSSSRRLFQV